MCVSLPLPLSVSVSSLPPPPPCCICMGIEFKALHMVAMCSTNEPHTSLHLPSCIIGLGSYLSILTMETCSRLPGTMKLQTCERAQIRWPYLSLAIAGQWQQWSPHALPGTKKPSRRSIDSTFTPVHSVRFVGSYVVLCGCDNREMTNYRRNCKSE